MTEKPRITMQFQSNDRGEAVGVDIFINAAGRERLLNELGALSERNDHFHLYSVDWMPDGGLSNIPYQPEAQVGHHLKVSFRPDEWDREYFPHVFPESTADDEPE